MPVGISFKSFVEQNLGKFPRLLIYAILEWVMIILLFVDGLLAFVSNEFAKLFELRIPCLLCTRIGHVLVRRNSSFYYNDSVCDVHKKEISSLAYCHMHKKLSDIHSMCQDCFLSFAAGKDSDHDKYKSVVGILHRDVDSFVEEERKLLVKPVKNDDTEQCDDKSDIPRCSCCGEPLKLKFPLKYARSLSMNAPTPSPRAWLLANKHEEGRNVELPHIRYTELKSTSDTESDAPKDDAPEGENQNKQDDRATAAPLLPDSEEISEAANRTPSFARRNRSLGFSFDSAQMSPRWLNRSIRKPSVDKSDLVGEPNDASAANEEDGDILNHLKRQVRLDHKSLMALYMELNEERSAAAVAANNAMAMITQLQAEKAAIQMEALQYQRMMEEEAEYEKVSLLIMRDMIFKREEDIKALESELKAYREKYGQIKNVGSKICEVDVDDNCQDIKSQSFLWLNEKSDCFGLSGADQNEVENGGGNQEESSLDFEGESSYLLGLLTDLEKKMNANGGSNSSDLGETKQEDEGTGTKNEATLTREYLLSGSS